MHKLAYTTRDVAQLANSQVTDIYNENRINGKWRGVCPSRTPNGRLSWNRRAVELALGLMTPEDQLSQEQKLFVNWIEDQGIPCTPEVHSTVVNLAAKIDMANDPRYVVDRSRVIAAIVLAHNRFTEAVWHQLTPADRSALMTSQSLMTELNLPTGSESAGDTDATH